MARRTSKYASMTASDLARETRARGLEKPDVTNISEWADWLEALDAQRVESVPVVADETAAFHVGTQDEQNDDFDALDYVALSKTDLEALVVERQLEVVGTGANGNVLRDDLLTALYADDSARTEADDGDAD